MIDDRTPDSEAPAPAATPTLDEDDAGSTAEFATVLAEHERATHVAADVVREFEVGARVRGTLISIGDEHSLVDVGGRSEGVIETRHLKNESGALERQVGDALELFVVQAGDSLVLAPSVKAEPKAALQQLREALASRIPVSGKVTGRNAGGLEVDVSGVRGFCPASQIELGFCADPSVYVGRTLEFLVTEIKDGRNVVMSRRGLLKRASEEQGKRLLDTIKPGDDLKGRVARLEPFGAFVDLGGIDGLVHVSEIRHDRTGHPSEALKVGESVQVRVLRVDKGKDGKPRVALSIKAAAPDPWVGIETRFAAGDRVTGTVVRLTDFGAFVNLAPGIDGLVHVSEVSSHPVAHAKDVLAPQQQIEAVVLGVDPVKKRIALSIRDAAAGASAVPDRMPKAGETAEGFVSGIKPFGLFVDLPAFGRRARGLVPREETGAPRDSDLTREFTTGQALEVEVVDVKDGRIRLRMRGVTTAVEGAVTPGGVRVVESRPPMDREAGREGSREGGRDGRRTEGRGGDARGGRRDEGRGAGGGGGAGRAPRGGGGRRDVGRGEAHDTHGGRDDGRTGGRDESRDNRRDSRPVQIPQRQPDNEPTVMALAFKKALEKAREKEQKS